MSAFFAEQRKLLEAIAQPVSPAESFKSIIRRVARKGGLTASKGAKAWRGYTVLRADEWERVKAAAGAVSQRAEEDAARGELSEVLDRLERIELWLASLSQNGGGALADPSRAQRD